MVEVTSQWKSVADRERWAVRGASFVAKLKATKVVWFPPKPVETGATAASTATKVTGKTTKKAAKKATKKAASTTTGAAKKVSNPVRPKKKT